MTCVIAHVGKKSEKRITPGGFETELIPFVGADRAGKLAQVGIGYIDTNDNSNSFWGLLYPNLLVRSWRAMKLFELLQYVNNYTLAHCWEIIKSDDLRDTDRFILQQFESFKHFVKTVEEIRESVPDDATVCEMLDVFMKSKIYVNTDELIEELDADFLLSSLEMKELFAHEEMQKLLWKKQEKELNIPVSPEQSLSIFFKELQIKNFTIGGGIGAYGLDWGHIKIEELDRIAKQDSQYCKNGHYLEITQNGPDNRNFGVVRNFGSLQHPKYVSSCGTKYVFERARWSGDCFKVFTRIDETSKIGGRKHPVNEYVGEFTISQLRNMIKIPKKHWWQKIPLFFG